MIGVLLTEPDCVSLLLGVAEELLHLVVVVKAHDEHGVVMIVIDHVGNTDATGSEERNSMAHVVASDDRVVGEVKGLLGSHEVEGVV